MIRTLFSGTLVALIACGANAQSSQPLTREMEAYRERMRSTPTRTDERGMHTITTGEVATRPRGAVADRANLITPFATDPVPPAGEVLEEIPDPLEAERVLAQRLAALQETTREERIARKYERVVQYTREYLAQTQRTSRINLSLEECVARAIENNYDIQINRLSPAIAAARLVEAAAAFDAEFFLDSNWSNIDQPTAAQLAANQSDTRSVSGGFRKLLPTGARGEVSLGQTRTRTDLQFATINPAWDTTFRASFTQPLLRGFGLDVNRAQINIARADQRISREEFSQTVRDRLLDVERAYWSLWAARCNLLILAEAVAQNRETYESIRQRLDHDATPIELNNSLSRWKRREVEFKEAVRQVLDAEDALKNVLNDPELLLSNAVELVPTATPLLAPVALDHFSEVRTALDHRSEIRAAHLNVERARIQTGVAKNDTLPQLDLSFVYNVQGLARGADGSFDNATTNRFRSYTVQLAFAIPVGNRAAEARLRQARLGESQTVQAVRQIMDGVVTEVNAAVRQLLVRFSQIPPQYASVVSAVKNLQAFQARTTTINPSFLENELTAIEQIVTQRRTLVQVIADYNVALIELERAKGTLLEFNNVNIVDGDSQR